MTTTEKLQMLISRCKASVTLTVNPHKDEYKTVKDYISDLIAFGQIDSDDIAPETLDKMIEKDTIIDLHFYPNTPVGFYDIVHYDLDAALDEALELLDV